MKTKKTYEETFSKGTKANHLILEKVKAYVAKMSEPNDMEIISSGSLSNGNSFITIQIEY